MILVEIGYIAYTLVRNEFFIVSGSYKFSGKSKIKKKKKIKYSGGQKIATAYSKKIRVKFRNVVAVILWPPL